MNTAIKKAAIVVAVSAALTLTTTSTVFAGVSANVGVMSDYVWRGWSQNDNDPSVMGGLDYEASNGLYVGTWAAQVEDGGDDIEVDLYAGFAKELSNGFGYDVGVISYNYPGATGWDFTELYVSGSYKFVEAGVAQVISADDDTLEGTTYTHLSLSKDFGPVSASTTVGNTDFDAAGADSVQHFQVAGTYAIPKNIGDLTVAYDKTDDNSVSDDEIISLTWSKGFDF